MKKLNINNIRQKVELNHPYTYKELCSIINQDLKGGNQKVKQLQEWETFFNFHKENRKLVITEIYEKQKELVEEIKPPAANSIYVKYIEVLLMQQLSKHTDTAVYLTNKQLWFNLGMINCNYIECYNDKDKLLNIDGMTEFEINSFYQRSYNKLSKILESSLSSLQRRKLIYSTKTYRIAEHIKGKTTLQYRDATNAEIKAILKIERKVMREMGFSVYLSPSQAKKYYAECNKVYRKQFGWNYVSKCYKIIFNQEDILEELPDEQKRLEKLKLNYLTTESINTHAETVYHNKQSDKTGRNLYPEQYIDLQHLLAENLLKLDQTEEEYKKTTEYFKKLAQKKKAVKTK